MSNTVGSKLSFPGSRFWEEEHNAERLWGSILGIQGKGREKKGKKPGLGRGRGWAVTQPQRMPRPATQGGRKLTWPLRVIPSRGCRGRPLYPIVSSHPAGCPGKGTWHWASPAFSAAGAMSTSFLKGDSGSSSPYKQGMKKEVTDCQYQESNGGQWKVLQTTEKKARGFCGHIQAYLLENLDEMNKSSHPSNFLKWTWE